MTTPITRFRGEYSFLSNFHPATVTFDGVTYSSVERAFQSAKTFDSHYRRAIEQAPPSDVKRLGRAAPLRPDWESVKVSVMLDLLRQKFAPLPVHDTRAVRLDTDASYSHFLTGRQDLARLLLATGDRPLVEGNTWGDTFWGVCRGVGENRLGLLLMQVRSEIRDLPKIPDAP